MLRLIDTGAGPPDANLALDEALWRAFAGTPVLHVYGWEPEALSLGRFQDVAATVAAIPVPPGAPVVRRTTGGGAIWHHAGELTYGLVCAPGQDGVPTDVAGSYAVLHGCVVTALARFGMLATARGEGAPADERPALCFERRMPVDLLVGRRKLCGSAQRRRPGALLQQGSILRTPNPLVPTATCVEEVAGRTVPRHELLAALVSAMHGRFGGRLVVEGPTPEERALAARLRETRYGNPAWTARVSSTRGA